VISQQISAALEQVKQHLRKFAKQDHNTIQANTKNLANTLGSIFVASLLFRHAAWSNEEEDVFVIQRWLELHPLFTLFPRNEKRSFFEHSLAMGNRTNFIGDERIHSKL
jgi:hypothetical protein